MGEAKYQYDRMYYREALRACYFEFQGAFDRYRDVCKAGIGLPQKDLVLRYLEWQLIILSPICPHICEHAWGDILKKPGSILDATFPEPTAPVDDGVVAQGTYVFDQISHDAIKLMEKASKQGAPIDATIYVAKSFPEWKAAVLELMRSKHKASKLPLVSPENMKSDDTAKAQWKDIMQELMQNSSLKPFGKQLGPFAAFKRDEAAASGINALDDKSPFDEMELLRENAPFIKDKLKMDVFVRFMEDPSPGQGDRAKEAQPLKPAIVFGIDAAGKPSAEKSANKPANKPAAGKSDSGKPASKVVAKTATITDLKKLNEHLSTRSYFDGTPAATQADFDQLKVTPSNIKEDEHPHVARWHRHVSFLSQRRSP